ncbi:MAG: 4-hydroxythreonine-4-phosphate dehydrogenase PdxA, partial [Candidatus Latescibacterota bacterium]
MSDDSRPLIGVTVGDPAGVGPEIVIKALRDGGLRERVRPVVYADRACLQQSVEMLGVEMELNEVASPADGKDEAGVVDFVEVGSLAGPIAYGQISAEGGQAGYAYLDRAIDAALAGEVVGLATAPLNKESLQAG